MSIVKDTQIGALGYSTPTVHLIEVTPSPNARASTTNVVGLVAQAIRGEVGKIYTVGTLLEYEKSLGGYNTIADGYLWAKNFFDANGSLLKVVRAGGSNMVKATGSIASGGVNVVFNIEANTVGSWGNQIEATVTDSIFSGYFNLTIRNKATQEIREFKKVTSDEDDTRYLMTLVNQDPTKFFNITMVLTDGTVPTAGVTTLTNGSDGTLTGTNLADSAYVGTESSGVRTGIQAFKAQSAEDVIMVQSARLSATINSALITHVSDIRLSPRRTIIAFPEATDVETAITNMASYDYDKVKVVFNPPQVENPFTGELEYVNPTSFESANDTLLGYHQSASQSALPANVRGLKYELSGTEVDQLTANRINPYILKVGRGFIRASDYTASANPQLAQNVVRKAKDYFGRTFYALLQNFISKPITAKLWKSIRDAMVAFLRIEANANRIGHSTGTTPYAVKCDSENNPTDIVQLNRIRIDCQISLLAPADIIEIYLDASQDKTITNA